MIKIRLEDGTEKHYDVVKDIIEWKAAHEIVEDQPEVCCLHSLQEGKDLMHETFATVLTKAQVKNMPEAPKAMEDEIKKFESFDAFEKVNDEGQFVIKTRWVFTEHTDESKGYKLKARLCMRGFQENVNPQSDSPTIAKESLKVMLAVSANEGFRLVNLDAQNAFLQGKDVKVVHV